MEPLIQLNKVGKFYPSRLTAGRLLRCLWPAPMKPKPNDFWALRDVSFELKRGTVLGVIGRNGMGKSTLLQLIAGLLDPSEGQVTVRGTVAALLELGAGFNPEFTGRENIFLSGSIYGYTQEMMAEKYEDVVRFADIGNHLDQPVKTYSSGMFARLAFAVAINVDPDLLLVDEILSVGDMEFQSKCFRKIETLREAGMSILFVSHGLDSVNTLCDEALLLSHGRMLEYGKTKEVIDSYMNMLAVKSQKSHAAQRPDDDAEKTVGARAEICDVMVINSKGVETIHPYTGEHCRVQYRLLFHDDVAHPVITLQTRTMLGVIASDITSEDCHRVLPPAKRGEEFLVSFEMDMNLCPGTYRFGVGVVDTLEGQHVPLFGREALTIEVISEQNARGIVYLNHSMSVKPVHTTQSVPGHE
ncbi:MAG: ABC transporter ATP-binding protein [Kiritimatiellae bacterium]|nr:ABC transporter ATP-binding protein [Kiritimatiellia bacterium]